MDKLLELLQNDARLTPSQLGQMLGISVEEVTRKIQAYEKDGIILGYQTILNEEKLCPDRVKAVIEVHITPEREGGFDRTAERIANFEEVSSCFLVSGAYDILLVVEAHTLQQVASFVASKLATLERVQSTSTHFMLKTYKDHSVKMSVPEIEGRIAISP